MIRDLLRPLSAALWCLGLAAPAAAQTLQLANGQVLLAKVEDADGAGLRVTRLDNGGVLELRWDHLSPGAALQVKRQFDLVGDSQDELLVRAEEVAYLINGQPNTVLGKVVERTGTHLVVQQKGVQYRVPIGELRQVRQVDVPATQVFTKDEFYADALARFAPGESADKHVLLAEDLVKVRDYDRALEHAAKAKELGNSRNPQGLDALVQRLQRYKEAAKERELLDQIQASRSRGQQVDFEKGVRLVAQFEKDFPQTKLKAEFEAEKKRFGEARTRFFAQQTAEKVRAGIQVLADKKAGDPTATLATVRDYAENKMTDELFERAAQLLKLDLAEVKTLWADRAKYPVGKRTEHFAYGLGSWILGEQAVIKDTEVQKQQQQRQAQKPAAGEGNDRDVDRVARLLKQAMERRRAELQGAGGEAQQEETDEQWWQKASRVERAGWLRAYYAEFGGQLKVTYAAASECISCYGAGKTPQMGPDGKMAQVKCFLCHGTKWLRSFKAY